MIYLLQQLLTKSAEKYPEKPAVVLGEEQITYKALDITSNKLARYLVELGVKRGDRVGIYMNKSIPSIISIFSILKAGAVYVPLDPQAPTNRIAYIIDNCEIKHLLTSSEKMSKVTTVVDQSTSLQDIIVTDDAYQPTELSTPIHEWKEIESMSSSIPDNKNITTDLAYIIYTSGSTGNPKGVMISHLNSLTFVNWSYEAMGVNENDRFSSHAPLHFDLSIFDVFVCPKAGGTLYLVPETLSMFPTRLSSWIADNAISVWYSVPSVLSMMVTRGQLSDKDFTSLRRVIFAGEVFPTKYLRQLMDLIPHPEYYNLYGPTETNVITYYQVLPIPEDQTAPIPIGICCENTDTFALDAEGNVITEPGQEGELLARGTCVAMGYWGDSEKTNSVFTKNPVQTNFSENVYHTGDLVSIDENGNFLYKGRIDHMIKSRGYRIELGEIEATIYSHPMVKEVAVIAIPDDLITNRIKATVVVSQELSPSVLRTHCSDKLPKYMIPEMIEFMDSLPKTSTGKVDKQNLLKSSLKES